jgi:hypothetical protein
MPVCTSAERRLPCGLIAYRPHTRPVAASVPGTSPRGTLKRDRGWPVTVCWTGAAWFVDMLTPVRAWLPGQRGGAAGRVPADVSAFVLAYSY